jgi:excisionase family DNA binding protein
VGVGSSSSSLYDARVVDEAYYTVAEVPQRLKASYRTVYRWARAGGSITYKPGRELRVAECKPRVFVGFRKASCRWEGS